MAMLRLVDRSNHRRRNHIEGDGFASPETIDDDIYSILPIDR